MKKFLVGLMIAGLLLGSSGLAIAGVGATVEWGVEAETLDVTLSADVAKDNLSFDIEWTVDILSDSLGTITPSLDVGPFSFSVPYNLDTEVLDPTAEFEYSWEALTFETEYTVNTQEFATTITLEF